MMLVLSRRPGERIEIGNVVVTVLEAQRGKVRLGVDAPRDTDVHRGEVADAIRRQRGEA